jgi:hypothetical protein
MGSPTELRAQAARFLTLVQIARQDGDTCLASVLTDKAARLMELADAAEAGQMIPPPPLQATRPNTQQQQQIRPTDDNERS